MKHALICFLKYPEPGHVKTRLAPDLGEDGAADFYSSIAERVITEVYPLNRDYDLLLYVDPHHTMDQYRAWLGDSWKIEFQKGRDLGERMQCALGDVLASGYEKAAIIGSDCIGMDEDFIDEVFNDLDSNDFVIGPSSDGGYFLLALKESYPWLFERVTWSSEEVIEVTLDRIEAREMTVKELDEKMDVDTIKDLVEFRKSLPEVHFLARKIDQIILARLAADGKPGKPSDEGYAVQPIDGIDLEEKSPNAAADMSMMDIVPEVPPDEAPDKKGD